MCSVAKCKTVFLVVRDLYSTLMEIITKEILKMGYRVVQEWSSTLMAMSIPGFLSLVFPVVRVPLTTKMEKPLQESLLMVSQLLDKNNSLLKSLKRVSFF
jgi:hypothetical protein